eukprot:6491074-Amphidinium_carterae.3
MTTDPVARRRGARPRKARGIDIVVATPATLPHRRCLSLALSAAFPTGSSVSCAFFKSGASAGTETMAYDLMTMFQSFQLGPDPPPLNISGLPINLVSIAPG